MIRSVVLVAGLVAACGSLLCCASASDPYHPSVVYQRLNERLRETGPLDQAPPERLAELRLQLDDWLTHHPAGYHLRLTRARVCLASGDDDQALQDLRLLDDAFAPEPDVLTLIARLRLEHGQSGLALDTARRALDLDPRHTGALMAMGRVLAAAGAHDVAVRYYDRVLELDPDHAEAARQRDISRNAPVIDAARGGGAARVAGRADAALLDTGSTESQRERGLRLIAAGEEVKGVAELIEWLRSHPDDIEALVATGVGLARQNQMPVARRLLSRVVELEPDHVEARMALGSVLMRMGTDATAAEAADHFERVAEQTADPEALVASARARARLGDLLLAEQHFTAALATGEPPAAIYIEYGRYCTRQGALQQAADIYADGLAAHPDDTRLQANRMAVLYRLGFSDEARQLRDSLANRDDLPDGVARLVAIYSGGE